jgi:hypothetical protein
MVAVSILALGPSLAIAQFVTLVPTAEIYAPGETVRWTITNNTDFELVSGSEPPYDIYRLSDGEWVTGHYLPMEWHILPSESRPTTWDQRDINGELVAPGSYFARVSLANGPHPPHFTVLDTFIIGIPTSAPDGPPEQEQASGWGKIKFIFRSR